jgi:hypothetical protein
MGSQVIGQVVTVPGLQWTASSLASDAGGAPVFWIYIDDEGHWCLRKEGGPTEASFSSRAAAAAFVQHLAGNARYVLFIETQDGRVVQEQHGAASSPRGEPQRNTLKTVAFDAGTDATQAADLGRRLEWAHQLESAGRVSPSRRSVLADWFRAMW